MLNEVVVAYASINDVADQLVDSAALMIAGEDKRFADFFIECVLLGVIVLLLIHLQGDEVLQQVEQVITAQHVLPDVGCAVATW